MIYRDALLKSLGIPFSTKDEIAICSVKNDNEGAKVAKDLLYGVADRNTSLFLSGGRSPKKLYELIAKDQKMIVGSLGVVDERFGNSMHESSNEFLLQSTGILDYFKKEKIVFHSMLSTGKGKEELAQEYNNKVQTILKTDPQSIAILGIGLDGHTAGIPAGRQNFNPGEKEELVISYDKFPGPQTERISMTFKGLSQVELLIVLVFGDDKKEAFQKMFQAGTNLEIPARFLKNPEVAKKTLLITDQKV